MKIRILTYILILLTGLLTAACGNRERTYRIGVSQCSSDEWRRQMNEEMLREASFYKGVELDIRTAYDNSRRQVAQIDSLINEGADLLVIAPNEAKALTGAVEKARAKGIPVVLVDRKVDTDKYTAFIGADNRSIGRDVGAYLASELKGQGTVVEFTGLMSSTPAYERHQGFTEALRQSSGIRLLASVQAGWEGPRLKQQLDSLLKAGPAPDAIFAPNDRTGVRISRMLRERGLRSLVVGIDGLAGKGGGIESVEKGELNASFVYPTGGDKVIQTAMRILRHEPYRRDTKLSSAVANAATVRLLRMQTEQVAEREARIDLLGSQLDKFLSRYSMQNMILLSCIVIIVLIGTVLAIGFRSYYTAVRRNAELASQKRKLEEQRDQLVQLSKELQETTQSKLTFFTEVSHDLRTPLTLILAPIEQLQGEPNLTPAQRDLLETIRANADILMRLVGQTLDFRKFEAGQLRLNVQHINLCESLRKWCDPFKPLARKRMIRYSVNCPQPAEGTAATQAWLDPEKMESVLYNLLSNAFKFTPEGGQISVTLTLQNDAERGDRLTIAVQDTGKGIDADKISHVFDRFYQADVNHEGSGIGLATAKAYVELHGGTIKAESTPGRGARFTLVLPCQHTDAAEITQNRLTQQQATQDGQAMADALAAHEQQAPRIDALTAHAQTVPVHPADKASAPRTAPAENAENAAPRTVLIIDDNADIRSYMRLLLGKDFIVEEASNGQEGLSKARQLMPDAVVCDVMMPVMDGWECCRRLKDEWQTSHIPVMMLTACTLNEQRITGFDCGADAYIAKPFSPDMFRSRLRNLIANRQRMRAFFGDKASLAKDDVSELDKGFAERFRALIEQKMGNAELSVEDLATDMGLGRSQLYRKVKSLTGYSPVELLRIARLKKAAELLSRTEKNVAEVAYEVGFSTPSYLTRCFREYFGVNPSEYGK